MKSLSTKKSVLSKENENDYSYPVNTQECWGLINFPNSFLHLFRFDASTTECHHLFGLYQMARNFQWIVTYVGPAWRQ